MNFFWFLCGNSKIPSSRIHGLNIHEQLVNLKYSSILVHVPDYYCEDLLWPNYIRDSFIQLVNVNDVIIIQKLNGKKIHSFALDLKRKGARLIFIDCDLPIKLNMALISDHMIFPSKSLAIEYSQAGFDQFTVIPDAVEYFQKPHIKKNISKTMVWFGKSGSGKWDVIQHFKESIFPIIAPNWQLIIVSDHKDSDLIWNISSYQKIISQFDLAVIPLNGSKDESVKSANRCTQAMALGLPVVANVILSYEDVIKNFENGLVSDNLNEWKLFFLKCENVRYLNTIKERAYRDSLEFSITNVIEIWLKILVGADSLRMKKNVSIFLRIKVYFFLLYSKYSFIRKFLT